MRTPPIPLGTTTRLEAISSGRHATSASATGPRHAIGSGSGPRLKPSVPKAVPSPLRFFLSSYRIRIHTPYSGIATAAASNNTPAIVSNIFSAIISRLRHTRCCALPVRARAPRVFWLPAMEQSTAGPTRQTSTPQTAAPQPPATTLLPIHPSPPSAVSSSTPLTLASVLTNCPSLPGLLRLLPLSRSLLSPALRLLSSPAAVPGRPPAFLRRRITVPSPRSARRPTQPCPQRRPSRTSPRDPPWPSGCIHAKRPCRSTSVHLSREFRSP